MLSFAYGWAQLRQRQRCKVAWTAAEELLLEKLRSTPEVKDEFAKELPAIRLGRLDPRSAARQLVQRLWATEHR